MLGRVPQRCGVPELDVCIFFRQIDHKGVEIAERGAEDELRAGNLVMTCFPIVRARDGPAGFGRASKRCAKGSFLDSRQPFGLVGTSLAARRPGSLLWPTIRSR